MSTALVLRALGLGDLLAGVPALRAVRRGLPRHEVVLAAPTALEPLALLSGAVDRVHDTAGLAPLHGVPPPDVAIDLHGRGPQSHELLLALGPRRLVAFAHGQVPSSVDGPQWSDDEHEVHRWCRLVESTGWPADPLDLRLPVPPLDPPVVGAVVVHPGAAFAARRWPAERFADVAASLAADGHRVVVTGSAGERSLAVAVAEGAGLPPSAVLAGVTAPLALAALVAHARAVVCGDTGVAHLATAYGTPSVVLFGPTPPSRWGPPAGAQHVALWHGDGPADPWGDTADPALLRIGVDEVLGRLRSLLAASRTTVDR